MLSCDDGCFTTGGILIQKENETRLAVVIHCWQDEMKRNGGKLGDGAHFRVFQGETLIGNFEKTLAATDIGLAKLFDNTHFSNRLLDIDTVPKTLVRHSDILLGDTFLIDSIVTGKQRLMSIGVRVLSPTRGRELLRDCGESPPDGTVVTVHQGIYSTNTPVIHGSSKLRPATCGSLLIRKKRQDSNENRLRLGEVCGIMHWAGPANEGARQTTYLCFTDPVKTLIDSGWEVAPS